jgi:hypothetical protein
MGQAEGNQCQTVEHSGYKQAPVGGGETEALTISR